MRAENSRLVILLPLVIILAMSGCGQDREFDSLGLTLSFGPETVPDNTYRLTAYVLPSIVTVNGQDEGLNCDLFVGPTSSRTVYDYSSFLVSTPKQVLFNPTQETAVSIDKLPPGLLIFLVEALDESSNPLALGCGKGQIDRGEKTFITIYMEEY